MCEFQLHGVTLPTQVENKRLLEFNLSKTVFLHDDDSDAQGSERLFTPIAEMPFAGRKHPFRQVLAGFWQVEIISSSPAGPCFQLGSGRPEPSHQGWPYPYLTQQKWDRPSRSASQRPHP